MLFNSIEFLIFFPIVTALYFFIPHKYRWLLFIGCKLFFLHALYSCLHSDLILYNCCRLFCRNRIENAKLPKKNEIFPGYSLVANIGILAVFKYYNFFIDNMNGLFHMRSILRLIPLLCKYYLPIGFPFILSRR